MPQVWESWDFSAMWQMICSWRLVASGHPMHWRVQSVESAGFWEDVPVKPSSTSQVLFHCHVCSRKISQGSPYPRNIFIIPRKHSIWFMLFTFTNKGTEVPRAHRMKLGAREMGPVWKAAFDTLSAHLVPTFFCLRKPLPSKPFLNPRMWFIAPPQF